MWDIGGIEGIKIFGWEGYYSQKVGKTVDSLLEVS